MTESIESQIRDAIENGNNTAAKVKKYLKKEHDYENFDEDQEALIKQLTKKRKAGDDGKKEKKPRVTKRYDEQEPFRLSETMQKITNLEYLPRLAVLKMVWNYIGENKLPKVEGVKPPTYYPDDLLKEVYGDEETLAMGAITKGISAHLTKIEKSEIPESDWQESLKVLEELQAEVDAKKGKRAANNK